MMNIQEKNGRGALLMISLKWNNKGEYVPATGLRTRKSSIYTPNQSEDFKISRSKLSDFRKCRKCFYLDRVRGLKYPGMPGWALNALTGALLKVEPSVGVMSEPGSPPYL